MKYYDLYLKFLKKYNKNDDENINNDFFNFLYAYSKNIKNIADFYVNRNSKINLNINTKSFLIKMKQIFEKKIPLAIINRNKYFYGNKLYLRKGVLIPRSETELLVDKIILDNYNSNLKILDLCAGSGNIGLTLAKNLKADVTLVEKYNIPYAIMLKNKRILNLSNSKVHLKNKDIKEFLITNHKKFDVIVMNPPYIKKNDKNVENNVIRYEPKTSLFAKQNGLYFYKLVLNYLPYLMKSKCLIYFEIGFDQKDGLIKLLNKIWWRNAFNFNYEFIKDYNGYNRILKISISE